MRRLLGPLVDVAVGAGGRVRVGGGAADLAGLAVGEAVGEFGGDVGQAALLQLQPVALRAGRGFAGGEPGGAGAVGVGGEGVPAAGGGSGAAPRTAPGSAVTGRAPAPGVPAVPRTVSWPR
ncbi:hypothetical protein GCM10010295_15700 [Streptomyces intermedius]